jgi:hypothetical protein
LVNNMANRRNFRRHRGLSGELHGSPAEVESGNLPEFVLAEDAEGVRAAKVARAKALIADPDYPPKTVLDSVAGLLAGHLQPQEPE